ncbi:iron-sulfur binding hydrogenase [Fervidobacterium islandicum]|uniref:iron-sulfur binding hydrogenase n=1 Tax=Fervidobacterium islandicum TaxID=2423 RepID=UPI003A67058D
MKISEIAKVIGLREVVFCNDYEIEHCYVGDLLSVVMRSAQQNTIWLTVQSHVNIIAVAALTGIKAIVLCEGLYFTPDTIEKAKEEGINLYSSLESSYILAGKIYELGIR